MERIKVESLLSIYLGRNCMHLLLLVRETTTSGILGACSSSTKMVTGNPDAMAFGIPLVLTVCICMESGYVLRTTDYGYRQHEREHENLVEQPGTLGLKLTEQFSIPVIMIFGNCEYDLICLVYLLLLSFSKSLHCVVNMYAHLQDDFRWTSSIMLSSTH
ncbi:hypothetical protein V1477_010222 [Vespula maculifrons]|uniref:Uncharacterized protein n=1 Tax=Vespula maculifrons TaxID=7453 RepID=A0ABD2C7X3_VESMC